MHIVWWSAAVVDVPCVTMEKLVLTRAFFPLPKKIKKWSGDVCHSGDGMASLVVPYSFKLLLQTRCVHRKKWTHRRPEMSAIGIDWQLTVSKEWTKKPALRYRSLFYKQHAPTGIIKQKRVSMGLYFIVFFTVFSFFLYPDRPKILFYFFWVELIESSFITTLSKDRKGTLFDRNNRSKKRTVLPSSDPLTSCHGIRISKTPFSRHISVFKRSKSCRYWKWCSFWWKWGV